MNPVTELRIQYGVAYAFMNSRDKYAFTDAYKKILAESTEADINDPNYPEKVIEKMKKTVYWITENDHENILAVMFKVHGII